MTEPLTGRLVAILPIPVLTSRMLVGRHVGHTTYGAEAHPDGDVIIRWTRPQNSMPFLRIGIARNSEAALARLVHKGCEWVSNERGVLEEKDKMWWMSEPKANVETHMSVVVSREVLESIGYALLPPDALEWGDVPPIHLLCVFLRGEPSHFEAEEEHSYSM